MSPLVVATELTSVNRIGNGREKNLQFPMRAKFALNAASGKRQAASGKRQAASGKRQAASGKRQAASGKRQAASG
ncbi:MAG: hypothetical protein LBK76_07270, partial [Verrucomicrobiales bacterium]|nr:hypothetical protein [Verrucomicrobiales bacterium]